MNAGRTVFSQLIEFLPHQEFQKCIARYCGGRYLKKLSCWDQYLAMAFAQLTYRESLRDIEACLAPSEQALSHGIPRQGSALDAGRRQRIPRLANLRRLRSGSDRYRSPACMRTIRSASIWIKACMPWTPRPSICACRCFRGQSFASTRPPSRCIPCWTCTATSPRLSALPTGKCTMSTFSTRFIPEAGAFYVMDRGLYRFRTPLRLHAQLRLLCSAHQSERACCRGATRIPWTRAPACAPIRPSF